MMLNAADLVGGHFRCTHSWQKQSANYGSHEQASQAVPETLQQVLQLCKAGGCPTHPHPGKHPLCSQRVPCHPSKAKPSQDLKFLYHSSAFVMLLQLYCIMAIFKCYQTERNTWHGVHLAA